MSEIFSAGDKVIFGRRRGEQTRGTVIKVNRTRIKIRQDESRGTMRDYPVGTIWTVAWGLVTRDLSTTPVEQTASTEPSPVSKLPDVVTIPDPVIGATVVKVRPMTDAEVKAEYWSVPEYMRPTVLELSTGARLYALRDDEGNGPGVLVGMSRNGESFRLDQVKAI